MTRGCPGMRTEAGRRSGRGLDAGDHGDRVPRLWIDASEQKLRQPNGTSQYAWASNPKPGWPHHDTVSLPGQPDALMSSPAPTPPTPSASSATTRLRSPCRPRPGSTSQNQSTQQTNQTTDPTGLTPSVAVVDGSLSVAQPTSRAREATVTIVCAFMVLCPTLRRRPHRPGAVPGLSREGMACRCCTWLPAARPRP